MTLTNSKVRKTVLTYGTFDYLHIGHINILKRAKLLGDHLIVGLSTEEFNQKKQKFSHSTFNERKEILESLRFVDQVIAERDWEQKIDDIERYEVDVFVMGDDWLGKFDNLKDYCEVVYLPRTKDISTSIVKRGLVGGGGHIEY